MTDPRLTEAPFPPETLTRFWAKVEKRPAGCWLWTGSRDGCGYGTFSVGRAHRVSWIIANGPIPQGMRVLHHCDVPPCVRPDHLFLGTPKANNIDFMIKGRRHYNWPMYGEKHPAVKLTEAQVLGIERRRKSGEKTQALANEFSVSIATVNYICAHRRWRHLWKKR